jgi:hypothetical protein
MIRAVFPLRFSNIKSIPVLLGSELFNYSLFGNYVR